MNNNGNVVIEKIPAPKCKLCDSISVVRIGFYGKEGIACKACNMYENYHASGKGNRLSDKQFRKVNFIREYGRASVWVFRTDLSFEDTRYQRKPKKKKQSSSPRTILRKSPLRAE